MTIAPNTIRCRIGRYAYVGTISAYTGTVQPQISNKQNSIIKDHIYKDRKVAKLPMALL